ncbi:hypothetical protein [Tibeticola sediminis]|uniref:hypothetical protein n=1 Tax=Tibeticola sediminis TaxID=1917811 RepID=UPI0011CD4CB0|nr:hypothetical protein [Tibeticola sediminis]
MLDAIARDIDQHPDVLRPVDAKLAGRCRALSAGLDVDLDVPLPRELGDAGMPWLSRLVSAANSVVMGTSATRRRRWTTP